jgi:hypothetical protein
VTFFPAAQPSTSGSAEVSQAFRRVASVYSNSTPVTFELVAAGVSGDLAYVVGYERASSSIGSGPVEPVTLRVRHRRLATRRGSRASCRARAPRSGTGPATCSVDPERFAASVRPLLAVAEFDP